MLHSHTEDSRVCGSQKTHQSFACSQVSNTTTHSQSAATIRIKSFKAKVRQTGMLNIFICYCLRFCVTILIYCVFSYDYDLSYAIFQLLHSCMTQFIVCMHRLCWFGHVVRNDGCINSIKEFEVVGQRGRGRPKKKTWKDTINNDLRHWKLSRADPANRMEWRKKLRTNIGAVRPTLSGTDTLNE